MRLLQIHDGNDRRVGIVEEPRVRLLSACTSIHGLANSAIKTGSRLSDLAQRFATSEMLDYDPIYAGSSRWRILPAIDHPADSARCLVSGTGLTHMGSARGRQSMHASAEEPL